MPLCLLVMGALLILFFFFFMVGQGHGKINTSKGWKLFVTVQDVNFLE